MSFPLQMNLPSSMFLTVKQVKQITVADYNQQQCYSCFCSLLFKSLILTQHEEFTENWWLIFQSGRQLHPHSLWSFQVSKLSAMLGCWISSHIVAHQETLFQSQNVKLHGLWSVSSQLRLWTQERWGEQAWTHSCKNIIILKFKHQWWKGNLCLW